MLHLLHVPPDSESASLQIWALVFKLLKGKKKLLYPTFLRPRIFLLHLSSPLCFIIVIFMSFKTSFVVCVVSYIPAPNLQTAWIDIFYINKKSYFSSLTIFTLLKSQEFYVNITQSCFLSSREGKRKLCLCLCFLDSSSLSRGCSKWDMTKMVFDIGTWKNLEMK